MEIERKWLVEDWPELPLIREHRMRQGYISVLPTVRIREEQIIGSDPEYILCFKSPGGLAREEIETNITEELFGKLEILIGQPLIVKERRTYEIADGLELEVNCVDQGQPTQFMYAEIEYETVEQAVAWQPYDEMLRTYLNHEVTGQKGQSMGAYWLRTREVMMRLPDGED